MHPYFQFGSPSILLSLLTGLFGASVLLINTTKNANSSHFFLKNFLKTSLVAGFSLDI
jgi:TctA family transporter